MYEVIEYAYHSGAVGCRGYMSQRVVATADTYEAATAMKAEAKAKVPKDAANNEFLFVISEVK